MPTGSPSSGRASSLSPGTSRAALDHYRRMIATCLEHGVTPMVTYCHFTTPRWFAGAGGWESDDAPELFARYADPRHRAPRRPPLVGGHPQRAQPHGPDGEYRRRPHGRRRARASCRGAGHSGQHQRRRRRVRPDPLSHGADQRRRRAHGVRPPHGRRGDQGRRRRGQGRLDPRDRRPPTGRGRRGALRPRPPRREPRLARRGARRRLRRRPDLHPVPDRARRQGPGAGRSADHADGLGGVPRVARAHRPPGRRAPRVPVIVTENGMATDDDDARIAYTKAALEGLGGASTTASTCRDISTGPCSTTSSGRRAMP